MLHTVEHIQDTKCSHSCVRHLLNAGVFIHCLCTTSGDQGGSDKPTITAATAALIANAAASAAAAAAASANDSSTFLSTEEIKKQLEAHRKALLIKYVAKLTHPGMCVT
jgi:LmbE family N-acetylglucosaminyl deacetylase